MLFSFRPSLLVFHLACLFLFLGQRAGQEFEVVCGFCAVPGTHPQRGQAHFTARTPPTFALDSGTHWLVGGFSKFSSSLHCWLISGGSIPTPVLGPKTGGSSTSSPGCLVFLRPSQHSVLLWVFQDCRNKSPMSLYSSWSAVTGLDNTATRDELLFMTMDFSERPTG